MTSIKYFTVSSSDRTSGTHSNFKVKLNHPIERIKKLFLETIIIPKTWYTIMSGINDTIPFEVATTDFTATLVEGLYSADELATEVATQMNSAYTPDNLFTCTVSTLTKKFTIAHPSATSILEFATRPTATTASTLGYNSVDTSDVLSHVADNIYNLSFSTRLFILSKNLGTSYFRDPDNDLDIIFVFPVSGGFGDFMTYQNQGGHWFFTFDKYKNSRVIDIQITFSDGATVVPLNGQDVTLVFSYETDD